MELHSGVAWRKKETVTNAKWANLFPFFTKSTLDISKAELASFDWAFLVEWINIVVQLSLDSFLKGDPFPYWFVARFSHWFLLEVPNNHLSTGKPWSHPSRKYFNLPSFPTKHHFLCYILFFAKQRKCHLHTKLLFLFLLGVQGLFTQKTSLVFFVTLSIVFSSLFLISYDLQTQKSNLRWELLDLPNITLLISRSKKKSTCFQVPSSNFLSTFSFSPRLFLNLVDPNLLSCTAFYEQWKGRFFLIKYIFAFFLS